MGKIGKTFASFLILIMAFSCLSLLMVKSASAQSTPVIIVSPTPAPTPTPSPAPTPTSNIALNYSEVNMTSQGSNTILVLVVTAQYNFGGAVTLNYTDFTLNIFTVRGGLAPPAMMMNTGNAKPAQIGVVTLNSENRKANFELTFTFATMQENFDGPHVFSSYQLTYTGSATSTSPTPTSTPTPTPTPTPMSTATIPEFATWIVLPLFAVMILLSFVFARKKVRLVRNVSD